MECGRRSRSRGGRRDFYTINFTSKEKGVYFTPFT